MLQYLPLLTSKQIRITAEQSLHGGKKGEKTFKQNNMKTKILLGIFALFLGVGTAMAITAPVAGCGVSECGGGNIQCCKDKGGSTYFKR